MCVCVRVCVQALAIVMDGFSDPELLCDLLEASRKRNVSVHLLLDHLNLKVFVNMWQEFNLLSKNFPVSIYDLEKYLQHFNFFLSLALNNVTTTNNVFKLDFLK